MGYRIVLPLVLSLSVFSSPAAGQPAPDRATLSDLVRDKVEDEFRAIAQSNLLMQVAEMQRVCELDDSTVKKLTVAAKGATEQFVKKHRNSIRRSVAVGEFNNNVPIEVGMERVHPAKKPDDDNEDTGKDEDVIAITISIRDSGIQVRKQHRNGSSSRGLSGGLNELRQLPVWSKTLELVVPEAKRLKYQQHVNQKKQQFIQTLVDLHVSRMSLELHLDQPQSEKLAALLEDQLRSTTIDTHMSDYRVRRAISQIKGEKFRALLNEHQRTLWKNRSIY